MEGGLRGPFRAWRSGLSGRSNYFCALVRRCASIRRAGRRPTTDQVLTSPERRQWFLPEGPPTGCSPVSGSGRSRLRQRPLQPQESIAPRREEAPSCQRRARQIMCNGGSIHSSGPHAKEDRADDQAHEQQAEAGPTAGECGIKPSQHVPRHDYSSWRRDVNYPRGWRV